MFASLKIDIDRDKVLTFRNVFFLGLVVAFFVTFSEFMRDKHLNFMIFSNSTHDFWNGICPYGDMWFRHGLDYFLYAPPFSVLFAPFAFLPAWLGPFVWNLFNYTLYGLAIAGLPRFDQRTKATILLYTLPILAAGQLSFQYNVAIAYIYIFAFTLMERGQAAWAVLLIMISAMTKVYGVFELSILLFYPRLFRNLGYAAGFGLLIACLPLLKLAPDQLLPYYGRWIDALSLHKDSRVWETFFNLKVFAGSITPTIMQYIQVGTISMLAVVVLACRKKWSSFAFRIQSVGILMGWMILFSNSAEKHTYVIALLGFMLWYWSLDSRTIFDKILFWLNFIVLVIVPVDIICPPFIMRYLFDILDLNLWIFTFTWLFMIYRTIAFKQTNLDNVPIDNTKYRALKIILCAKS